MERISERLKDVLADTIDCISEVQQDVIDSSLAKLSAYEGTGLEPWEIVDRHIIICQFQKIKLCKSDTGIFHPRAPGILAVTVIEKIITVTTRLKTKYFNLTKSANYSIK